MSCLEFPKHFLWGVATSAYQIEGSSLADGAGLSIWDEFCRQPGRILNGDSGDVACDHYRRYAEDVAIIAELGVGAYRFSIAWSRIFPDGTGRANQAGLDFYARLIDLLLQHNIQPSVTLYHWDLPQALEEQGGWLHRDSDRWFANYAECCFRALGDRVPQWVTFNEPWVSVDHGYIGGTHAPGKSQVAYGPIAAHNILRANKAAVDIYRSLANHQIGWVVNLTPQHPASADPLDVAAAERAHTYVNCQFLDPVVWGRYPESLIAMYGTNWPESNTVEAASLQCDIDFIGVNYYLRTVMGHDATVPITQAAIMPQRDRQHTAMGWEVYPAGLTEILCWVHDRYGDIPLYITENGAAFNDAPVVHDEIHDWDRVSYFRQHLVAAHDAIGQGVPLRGYFAWSLLDNFEWAFGYDKKFGLIAVDRQTQFRTLKDSAYFYRQVVHRNGLPN